MLPSEPPPWIARAIAWLLVALFCIALLAAVFVRLPETVLCRFVLAPKDGADPIQSPNLAVITELRVTEGAEVPAGAELFTLRSEEISSAHTQLQTLTEDLRAKAAGMVKVEEAYRSQLQVKTSEIAQIEREVTFRETHASTSRDLVARLKKLLDSGGASQVELIKTQLDLAASEKDLNIAQKSLDQATFERERTQTERARQLSGDEAEIHNLTVRIEALKTRLKNVAGDLLSIRAPYDAVVISLTQRNTGGVVQAGHELCQLARVNAAPVARLLIQERGLSRLSVRQRVRFSFDAFPYQRYGMIPGVLIWISPAAVSANEGRYFVGHASLDQTFIRAGENRRQLRVGMQGEARVIVGHRTLIDYAFEPVRQLRENMQR